MRRYRPRGPALFIAAAATLLSIAAAAAADHLRINEISDKGGVGVCNGEDWIELHLLANATAAVDLQGYKLHDDKGPDDSDAFTFPTSSTINPDEYLLICNGGADQNLSPQFGIGGEDQVTLLDASGQLISTTGALQGRGEIGNSFAYDESTNTYVYTSTPTPGAMNTITLLPEPETLEEMRERLIKQNDLGAAFFNMDGEGKPLTEGGFDEIVDLRMVMEAGTWDQMYADRSYEVYSPFLSATVTKFDSPDDVLLSLSSPGRLRPKGQSTLAFGTCMDRSVPYSIDFDSTNSNQTLFGVERAYLRTHLDDPSFVREWSQHRMLARFDLPHLRTRKVRFFVNGSYVGLYDLLEAPDQNYVFQRSFPTFDRENYALYKIKTLSLGCGTYDNAAVARAEARKNETGTPPYAFDRGEHRPKVPILRDFAGCWGAFWEMLFNEFEDVYVAWARADKDCGSMLVDEGLVDRDLGVKSLDDEMKSFINNHLGNNWCEDSQCSNSDLLDYVDADQFLKNFAVMASLLNSDSALGNGNNYYLAITGTGEGVSVVQYDHNSILSSTSASICDAGQCTEELIKWSVLRPTCRSVEQTQMAGPLLTNDALRTRFLDYVEEFVEDVMFDEEFIAQLHNHLSAIEDAVKDDDWGSDFAVMFHLELDQESEKWLHYVNGLPYIPFLPALKERGAEIRKQLQAIDAGLIPRSPDDIKAGEVCVNWEATEARQTICPENCVYDGCYRPEFDIPAFCSPEDGRCYHGVKDQRCLSVMPTQQYSGMEPFSDSDKDAFCWQDETLGPIKIAECPTYEEEDKLQNIICPENCIYDGCYRPEMDLPAFCSPDDGKCYHGVTDPKCENIIPTQQYAGMEPFSDSDKDAFCWQDEALGPMKIAECPTYYENNSDYSNAGGGMGGYLLSLSISFVLSLFGQW